MMEDSKIEYLYKPSSNYQRFGHEVRYNQYSMRSDDFSQRKTAREELRVLVIGDSVVEGGGLVDQKDIATERLRKLLQQGTQIPVLVGNASAKSWGPPNMLEYVKRYGFFDADVCIVVVSSHDVADVPTFMPIVGVHPDFPARKPVLAVEELFTRYLPRYVPAMRKNLPQPDTLNPEELERLMKSSVETSMQALRELLELAKASGAEVMVAQHLEKRELEDKPMPGHGVIADVAKSCGTEVIQLGPAMASTREAGTETYKDNIHLTSAGQEAVGEALFKAVQSALDGENGKRLTLRGETE
ncbi:hypothetical protein FEM03_22745 [Phragmitibacter flavus]|uniref:SGNH hydrolase-type esterase domain-containing protein n=1 Tax=Phragmitibacter flavus TaxID=2576071 RepID=A0A5R8K7V3_9BACT|nr:hypothetical protein [Phragmitibacter flavus]TLD68427.1 hypothetical protein FEM03_22745 [Phragmitibacter flavus]